MKKKETIREVLDSDYFHTHETYGENGYNWKVFYKNLPSDEYFSNKNKEILNSEENPLEDAIKLNEKLNKIKNDNVKDINFELLQSYHIFDYIECKITTILAITYIILGLCILLCSFFEKNKVIRPIYWIIIFTILVIIDIIRKKISIFLKNEKNKNKEIILKAYMKGKGIKIFKEFLK